MGIRREREPQAGFGDGGQAVPLDPQGDVLRGPGHVPGTYPWIGWLVGDRPEAARAAAEQGYRAAGVAAPGVREADGDLGQSPPQLALRTGQ